MIEITQELKQQIASKGLGSSLFSALEQLGITQVHGYMANMLEGAKAEPCINSIHASCIRSLNIALDSLITENGLDAWSSAELRAACEDHPLLVSGGAERSKKMASQASKIVEIESYGHLKSAFHGRSVTQVPERGGRGGKTPDFKVGDDIYVEVYCPDESNPERERVVNELANQRGNIRLAISRPVTGSASKAVQFATNQTIARVVGAKRENDQTVPDCKNILWLDVKYKLQLMACSTAPIQSVTHGENAYIGCFGLWHAFYGKAEESIFPKERYCLKYDGCRDDTYQQKDKEGLFRERPHMSAAVISCLDGNVLFLNPWCQSPLDQSDILALLRMYHFRPEFSFFCKGTLSQEILAQEERIRLLLDPQRVAQLSADGEGE